LTTGTDFLPVATAVGANVDSQGNFSGSGYQTEGFSAGIALPTQANKVWRQSSVMCAAMANYISDVLNQFIPDDGNLNALIASFWQALLGGGYFVDSGSTNNISVAAPAGLTFAAPYAGLTIKVKVANTTTNTVVLNWCGTGNKSVVFADGSAPQPGQIKAGGIYTFNYDGTNWQYTSFAPQLVRAVPQVFQTSGTYIIVSDSLKGTIVGGGGGGYGTNGGGVPNPAGGGAGATAIIYLSGLTIGHTLTVVVGTGGAGGGTGNTAGSNGAASVVSSGTQTITTVTAGGGFGASGGAVNGLGGSASNGTVNMQGNGGSLGIGGIAQPYSPYGNGGGLASNGVVVNGATLASQTAAQGIVVLEPV
jgi:hypothetical protein